MIWVERLAARERRVIALGVLVALLLVSVLFFVQPPLHRIVTLQQSVADGAFRVERLQGVAAQLPALRREVADLEAAIAAQGLTLDAASESLAGARLQERVTGIVTRHGAEVQSARAQPAGREEGLHRIDVRVQIQADSEELADILAEMEAARPLLVVRSLNVRALREADGRRGFAYRGRADVTLDVRAYWRSSAAGGLE